MSRTRAVLALLLVGIWCSAAWHADLEAMGLMLAHEHHAHDEHDADHAPAGVPHDDHEDIFARDVARDQIRVGAAVVAWVAFVGLAMGLAESLRPGLSGFTPLRERRETDPPLAGIWHFLRRCAPDSAAPPALG